MMMSDPSYCRKQTGKVVIAPTAAAGNGTVTMSKIKAQDTEYYQVAKHGDYVQENGYR